MDNLTYRFQQMMKYAATRGKLFFLLLSSN